LSASELLLCQLSQVRTSFLSGIVMFPFKQQSTCYWVVARL